MSLDWFPTTFVRDVQHAQKDFEKSMILFSEHVDYQDRAEPIENAGSATKLAEKKAEVG